MAVPNMVVTFGNGARKFFVYDETVYPGDSSQQHDAFVNKIIELSGDIWDKHMAEQYISMLPSYQYFKAIDVLRQNGKTLQESVEFLK